MSKRRHVFAWPHPHCHFRGRRCLLFGLERATQSLASAEKISVVEREPSHHVVQRHGGVLKRSCDAVLSFPEYAHVDCVSLEVLVHIRHALNRGPDRSGVSRVQLDPPCLTKENNTKQLFTGRCCLLSSFTAMEQLFPSFSQRSSIWMSSVCMPGTLQNFAGDSKCFLAFASQNVGSRLCVRTYKNQMQRIDATHLFMSAV